MDEKFNTILSIALIPQIVKLIVEKEKIDDITAISEFYSSKVYEMLAKEETKVWHYSPLTIYSMWQYEKETEELVFPEEWVMSKELPFIIFCIEEYKNQKGMTGKDVITLFNKYSVCEYIKDFYEALHTTGTKYIVNDIDLYIESCHSV